MEISHLLAKQADMADRANHLSLKSPLTEAFAKHMAESSRALNIIREQQRFFELTGTSELIRVNQITEGIFKQMRDAIGPHQDTISESIKSAMRSIEQQDSIARSMQLAQEAMASVRSFGPLGQLNETSAIIEQFMQRSPFRKMAESFGNVGTFPNLARALDPLQSAYQGWLDVVGTFDDATLGRLTPVIAIPSREYLSTIRTLRPIVEVHVDTDLEELVEGDWSGEDSLPEFEALVKRYSPESWERWRGAEIALKNRQPDYIRHVAVSLREFFDHLLLVLAPNEKIAAHLAAKGEKLKGKPGWGLRTEVATQAVGQPPFSTFMAERSQIFILTIDILQQTVHAPKKLHTHAQLEHHFRNCRSLAQSLLESRYLDSLR